MLPTVIPTYFTHPRDRRPRPPDGPPLPLDLLSRPDPRTPPPELAPRRCARHPRTRSQRACRLRRPTYVSCVSPRTNLEPTHPPLPHPYTTDQLSERAGVRPSCLHPHTPHSQPRPPHGMPYATNSLAPKVVCRTAACALRSLVLLTYTACPSGLVRPVRRSTTSGSAGELSSSVRYSSLARICAPNLPLEALQPRPLT